MHSPVETRKILHIYHFIEVYQEIVFFFLIFYYEYISQSNSGATVMLYDRDQIQSNWNSHEKRAALEPSCPGLPSSFCTEGIEFWSKRKGFRSVRQSWLVRLNPLEPIKKILLQFCYFSNIKLKFSEAYKNDANSHDSLDNIKIKFLVLCSVCWRNLGTNLKN